MENDGILGFSRKQPFLCFKYISLFVIMFLFTVTHSGKSLFQTVDHVFLEDRKLTMFLCLCGDSLTRYIYIYLYVSSSSVGLDSVQVKG